MWKEQKLICDHYHTALREVKDALKEGCLVIPDAIKLGSSDGTNSTPLLTVLMERDLESSVTNEGDAKSATDVLFYYTGLLSSKTNLKVDFNDGLPEVFVESLQMTDRGILLTFESHEAFEIVTDSEFKPASTAIPEYRPKPNP